MKTFTIFNINDYVRVKLTKRGREIHHRQYLDLVGHYTKPPFEYSAPKEDAEGWSEWQAWVLMQTFGQYMGNGIGMPFETNIQIEVKQ